MVNVVIAGVAGGYFAYFWLLATQELWHSAIAGAVVFGVVLVCLLKKKEGQDAGN